MESIRRERGESRRAAQAFRDMGLLVFLLLLLFSLRLQEVEANPSVTPLPDGVQAAGIEQAEPAIVEPEAVPALAIPDPGEESAAPPIARVRDLRELEQRIEARTRVLVLTGDTVRELRLPVHYTVKTRKSSCSDVARDVHVRS